MLDSTTASPTIRVSDTEANMTPSKISVREITPPESPRALNHTTLPPILTSFNEEKENKPSGKMSLDYIAPGRSDSSSPETCTRTLPRLEALSAAAAIHRGSRPSSPFLPVATPIHPAINLCEPLHHLQPEAYRSRYTYQPRLEVPKHDHHTPTASGLPSPAWSEPRLNTYSMQIRDNIDLYNALRDRRSSEPHSWGYDARKPLGIYTPAGGRSPRIHRTRHNRPTGPLSNPRSERYPYDAEERFALAYFRRETFDKKLEWKDVLDRYDRLFPPGQPRRYKYPDGDNKGLPPCYPKRDVQGLQCRLYRIRSDEKLAKSREAASMGGVDSASARQSIANELQQLEYMAQRDNLDPVFVAQVKQLASRSDINDVPPYSRV